MSDQALRVYVTDHHNLWQIYKIFLGSDRSFYRIITIKDLDEHYKYSYHVSGAVWEKSKQNEIVVEKLNWPNFGDLTIATVDNYGFQTSDFLQDDPICIKMRVSKIKPMGLIFDISKNINAFVMRVWFGKTESVMDFNTIKDRLIEVSTDVFVAAQFYNFGKIQTKYGEFDLSCVVALIPLESIDA